MRPLLKNNMRKTITQNLKLPKDTVSTGMAAVVVYIISQEIKNNISDNKLLDYSSNKKFIKHNEANVHSKQFEFRIGKDYRKYIDIAINNGDIKIFTKNGVESYKNGENAFCKAYSLNEKLYYNLKEEILENKEIQIKLKRNYKNRKDMTIQNDNKSEYALKLENYYKDLYFCDSLYDQDFYDYFDCKNNMILDNVNKKTTDLKDYSDKNRWYHPLIMMNKQWRKFIRHYTEKLVLIDASNFYPFLLAKFISDEKEKFKWLKLCNSGEFYTMLADVDKSQKEHYKKLFQVALTGKTYKGKLLNQLIEKLNLDFPNLMNVVKSFNEQQQTTQSFLQKLENKIFRNNSITRGQKWHLPMHDGLLILEKDLSFFLQMLDSVCMKELGYLLKFTTEVLQEQQTTPQQAQTPLESVSIQPECQSTTECKPVFKMLLNGKQVEITAGQKKEMKEKCIKGKKLLDLQISKMQDQFEKDLLIQKKNKLLHLIDKLQKL